MSPWLFNLYMDGVVKEFKARIMGQGVRMLLGSEILNVSCLLFADDTVILAESEVQLQHFVKQFVVVCDRRGLKLNVGKSKVMKTSDENGIVGTGDLLVEMKGDMMEEVSDFLYLGAKVSKDGGMEKELNHRITQARKSAGALGGMWNNRGVSIEVKRRMYESIVVPTVLYGSETWTWSRRVNKKVNVMEMSCLRKMCGVT